MAFSDMLLLVILAFALIITVLVMDYSFDVVMPYVEDEIPSEMNTSIQESWDTQTQFADNSFAAIWFFLAIVTIGLTIFLGSHPVVLIAWLFFNMILLFIYDSLDTFLESFLASELNTGAMDNAVNFIDNNLVKAVCIINMIIGIVLFGKRVQG